MDQPSMINSTRFKANPDKIYECYCEVSWSSAEPAKKPWIKRRFPNTYKAKEVLESVPKFACPCPGGQLQLNEPTQFSFVLTNIDSKWTFGYCRLLPAHDACLVLVSQLPWHETFFMIIQHIGAIYSGALEQPARSQSELLTFLKALYQCQVPSVRDQLLAAPTTAPSSVAGGIPSSGGTSHQLVVVVPPAGDAHQSNPRPLTFDIPDHSQLASIPQDTNLTEFYNTLSLDHMISLFASALNERHIIVTSHRLDRLSACVQALGTLLWPMHWQHIFIPILPADLLAYLQAPMPFLIGLPHSTYRKLKPAELAEVVQLMADDNVLHTPHEDVRNLPPGVVSKIKSELRNQVALGDSVSRAFLRALVALIGGYREALEFNDGKNITFNHDRFIATRPASFQPFLKKMLELQMFRQFIEGRLEMLNAGKGFNDDFEFEVNLYEERTAKKVNIQYQDWLNQMKTKGGVLFRSINPSFKLVCRGIKDRSKQAYKGWKVKLNETSQSTSQPSQSFFYSRMN